MSTTTTGHRGRATQTVTARPIGDRAVIAAALTDVDTVIASVPGLEVSPGDGDRRPARLTLRAPHPSGTTLVTYEGTVQVTDLDRDRGHLAMQLLGRATDTGAEGTADLDLTMLETGTTVQVTVEATAGEGIGDQAVIAFATVGRRLVAQLAHNLEATVSGTGPTTSESPGRTEQRAADLPDRGSHTEAPAPSEDLPSRHDPQDARNRQATSALIALGASVIGVLVGRAFRPNRR